MSSDSDANPQHEHCPTDDDTWCKYNKLALGLIDDMPPQLVPRISEHVGNIIRPLFLALSSDAILGRCQRAMTQNANESFNNLIGLGVRRKTGQADPVCSLPLC